MALLLFDVLNLLINKFFIIDINHHMELADSHEEEKSTRATEDKFSSIRDV